MRGNWENAISGKQLDNVRKETHVVSVMNKPLETVAEFTDEKDNRLNEREKNPQKIQATVMKALQIKGAKFIADTEIVIILHVVIGILPYVKTTSLRVDASMATSANFDKMRQMRSPARSQRKVA